MFYGSVYDTCSHRGICIRYEWEDHLVAETRPSMDKHELHTFHPTYKITCGILGTLSRPHVSRLIALLPR